MEGVFTMTHNLRVLNAETNPLVQQFKNGNAYKEYAEWIIDNTSDYTDEQFVKVLFGSGFPKLLNQLKLIVGSNLTETQVVDDGVHKFMDDFHALLTLIVKRKYPRDFLNEPMSDGLTDYLVQSAIFRLLNEETPSFYNKVILHALSDSKELTDLITLSSKLKADHFTEPSVEIARLNDFFTPSNKLIGSAKASDKKLARLFKSILGKDFNEYQIAAISRLDASMQAKAITLNEFPSYRYPYPPAVLAGIHETLNETLSILSLADKEVLNNVSVPSESMVSMCKNLARGIKFDYRIYSDSLDEVKFIISFANKFAKYNGTLANDVQDAEAILTHIKTSVDRANSSARPLTKLGISISQYSNSPEPLAATTLNTPQEEPSEDDEQVSDKVREIKVFSED